MIINLKKRKWISGRNIYCFLPTVQNNLNCLYLARVGTPDILWSVNKLARAVTKWTKACDKRLARGQEDGVPKAARNRRRRTREGLEPACVQTP